MSFRQRRVNSNCNNMNNNGRRGNQPQRLFGGRGVNAHPVVSVPPRVNAHPLVPVQQQRVMLGVRRVNAPPLVSMQQQRVILGGLRVNSPPLVRVQHQRLMLRGRRVFGEIGNIQRRHRQNVVNNSVDVFPPGYIEGFV